MQCRKCFRVCLHLCLKEIGVCFIQNDRNDILSGRNRILFFAGGNNPVMRILRRQHQDSERYSLNAAEDAGKQKLCPPDFFTVLFQQLRQDKRQNQQDDPDDSGQNRLSAECRPFNRFAHCARQRTVHAEILHIDRKEQTAHQRTVNLRNRFAHRTDQDRQRHGGNQQPFCENRQKIRHNKTELQRIVQIGFTRQIDQYRKPERQCTEQR